MWASIVRLSRCHACVLQIATTCGQGYWVRIWDATYLVCFVAWTLFDQHHLILSADTKPLQDLQEGRIILVIHKVLNMNYPFLPYSKDIQSPAYLADLTHNSAVCDRCMTRIQGEWFRCVYCGMDLCDSCETLDSHANAHFFMVFKALVSCCELLIFPLSDVSITFTRSICSTSGKTYYCLCVRLLVYLSS